MALFKGRRTDDDEPLQLLTDSPSQARRTSLPLPAILCALAGVALAAALLFKALDDSRQAGQLQLLDAWGNSQASALQLAQQQLQADTRAAAANPALLDALQSGDTERLAATEKALQHWHGLVDAHLNLTGKAALDVDRPGPLSFAALDLLRRSETGQQTSLEAYRSGDRWLLYSAAPLRASGSERVLGTLLLVVELDRLTDSLPQLPADSVQLTLAQQFAGSPSQTLLQRGQAGADALSFSSGNPNWQLSLSAGPGLQAEAPALPLLVLAVALALAGALLALLLQRRQQLATVQADAKQLSEMLKELAIGKSIKAFGLQLPALDSIAQQIARLPRRGESPRSETAPAAKTASAADLVFQSADVLDIDILDEDFDLPGMDAPPMNTPATPAAAARAPQLPASIFRAYDIRGVINDTLNGENAYWIGRAIGSESQARGEPSVVVARDGRLSGPQLAEQLIQGLLDCGCRVTDIGMVPTPVLYFATHVLDSTSGVMITGSHNPPDYNGFKIVIAGDTLAGEQIQALKARLDNDDLLRGAGSVEQLNILDRYFQHVRDDIALAKSLKVVVDCGNGVAGVIAPQLIEALGCSVIPMFCEVDGTFPNHHPDPGKPENLQDLIARVRSEGADLGLAFDGDGDRVGVVTNSGAIVYPDRLMMLFAKDVVSRNPGADIIYDVKCTRRLGALISGYGGRPVMWKTGHSLIKKKMKETGALLAGEMSGHIFFKERWFGFDDGLYSAARLLEILSQDRRDAEHVFNAFPQDISTPEINIEVTDESKFQLIDQLQRNARWGEANLTTLDGVRVDYPKGWGLVRASNTTPVLVLRFEADSEAELERIKAVFRQQLNTIAPTLNLPF